MADFWENDPIIEPAPRKPRFSGKLVQQERWQKAPIWTPPETDEIIEPAPRDLLAGKKPRWPGRSRVEQIDGVWVDVPEDFDMTNVSKGTVKDGAWIANPLEWSDVPSEALSNLGSSGAKFVRDMAQPFLHPIETAGNLAELGKSVLGAAGIADYDPSLAHAVGRAAIDRYGSLEAVKQTMATDPVGFASDVSTILTGGAALGARAPGLVGNFAKVAGRAGAVLDPANIVTKPAGAALRAGGNIAATASGVATGVGRVPIKTMFKSGYEGDALPRAVMRGQVDDRVVTDMAGDALHKVEQENRDAYRRDIATASAHTGHIDPLPVFQAIKDAESIGTYMGKTVNKEAETTRKLLRSTARDWFTTGNPDFQSVAGGNGLYQRINEIRATTAPGSRAQLVVDNVLHSLKGEIEKVAPGFSQTLKNYSQGRRNTGEIKKTLAMGPSATRDQTLRALQSTTRNGAQANYGQRVRLLDQLAQHQPGLPGALAGMSLNSWEPRSLARVGTPIAHALAGGLAGGLPGALVSTAAGMAAGSPRISGEVAYGAGRAARAADTLTPAQRRLVRQIAIQAGRANNTTKDAQEKGKPWLKYKTK